MKALGYPVWLYKYASFILQASLQGSAVSSGSITAGLSPFLFCGRSVGQGFVDVDPGGSGSLFGL